ncbi:uncharacterized protein PAN0_019d5756 [Moesziomyces antarcticus]|uniref:Uncharacterized protein n=2 Tax=Pseudozyma antarctica TaxID=84753 RepID=A0A081CLI2_PSEA2|nr:uncharacterized protein PAN0_019d5756 [Moesziomyces antarcticus]GAK67528.1 conserved hypothetical protein [Moesziomyces antarcticus]SPO48793.1 uncharacterized protein PSANT_06484 [Moesziomyces antarcticus]
MVATTKFTSLVGSVTLALVVASSLNAAPVLVRRDDAAAPAGYISVAQPQMTEQDIYAVGIPDAPAATPAGATFAQVIQAAAEAALAKSNQTMNAVNTYDPTPAPAGAAQTQSQVAPESNVAAAPNADAVLAGNPDQGQAFQQVIGNLAGAAQVAEGDKGLKGNPDEGDEYRQVIAQQMAQLGQKARRAMQDAVWEARQIPPPLASAGAPTAAPSTASVTDAVGDAPDAVTGVTDTATGATSTTAATDAATGVTDTAAGVASTAAGDTSTTAVTDAAGDVPVAAPVPSDYASPPAPIPSSNAAVPGVPAPAVPSLPSASSVPSAPAVPTSGLPTSGLPTSGVPSVPTSGLPTSALPTGAVPSAPAVPSASVPALPGLGGGLKDSDAGATTVNPSSPSASPTGDLTMTVTLPSTAMPTSLGDLANIKANANANADAINEWKTMTILVPAEAFGGSPSRAASVSAATSTAVSSSALASSKVISSTEDAKVTSTASAIVAVPTDPINLSSFSALKPQATGVLTIPLTGIIDGTTYSTMLTLTIPGVATETAKIPATATASASDKAATATAKPSITAAPSKTSSAPQSVKTTSSVDPSYIHPDDIPPLLKSSMQATPTSAPNPTSTPTADGDDEDCEDVDETDTAQPKSLLTKVWDWMSGKPLDERDFEDDYEDVDFEEYYDAQE